MSLDLTSLEKAIGKLTQEMEEARLTPTSELARDEVIQRFEYTYELSRKTLRRYLEQSEANADEAHDLSFQGLIRLGWTRGLLSGGWDRWIEYRKARGTTTHTYDHEKAAAVFAKIPEFLEEASFLLKQLKAHADL